MGKACVFDLDVPAVADGHVTIIRPDTKLVDPHYLCDYLRSGFGAVQVSRSYTGSTGMIELTPDQVDAIVVDLKNSLAEQRELSSQLRKIEDKYLETLKAAEGYNEQATKFLNTKQSTYRPTNIPDDTGAPLIAEAE